MAPIGRPTPNTSSGLGALLPADATVALVVADWRAKHAADPEGALAELYTLIARVRLAFAPRFPADTPRAPRAPP